MRVVDAIAEILKREGVKYFPSYPTAVMIEAAAQVGIRPIICRQERVGVGIADGYSRVSNGNPVGVFAMQQGPGAENAFSGVATAYSDSTPILVLPQGYQRERAGILPHFNSVRGYEPVSKSAESITTPEMVPQVMRRAFSALKMGRHAPAVVEIPQDVASAEVDESAFVYQPLKVALPAANPRDVDEVARVLVEARDPVIHAGQGVLYAEASEELVQLAELLQAPVSTTLVGKSAFPEDHPLALGTGGNTMPGPVVHFLRKADVIFGVGTSFTPYMTTPMPPGKTLIQATNDPRDIHKDYEISYPLVGDAKLVLGQLIEAVKDRLGSQVRGGDGAVAQEIESVRNEWLSEWMPKLTSGETPITPYRVIWELMQNVDPADAIVTHDAGSPRDQMIPFYKATAPRSYLGWGKSHGLGTGLGLTIGAKLAAPDKLCVHWMGDAAFGMVGLDFETAARCGIPILAIVSNNSTMAIETRSMELSHDLFSTRDIQGNYANIARDLGGYSERVDNPAEVGPAIRRARRATEEGQAALLEIITSEEKEFTYRRPF